MAEMLQEFGSKIDKAVLELNTKKAALVSTFTSEIEGDLIKLRWQRPDDISFKDVIIVRKIDTPPISPHDGDVIYSGTNTIIWDTNVLSDTLYCYTCFSRNTQNMVTYDCSMTTSTRFDKFFTLGVRVPLADINPDAAIYTDDCMDYTPANNTDLGSWVGHRLLEMIRPCVLNADGTVKYYLSKDNRALQADNATAVNLDGTDGDVMVEIPKLYTSFRTDDTYLHIKLSDRKINDNYKCLAHIKNHVEVDRIYVGAYLTSEVNEVWRSVKGSAGNAGFGLTLAEARAKAQERAGFALMDYGTWALLQVLYLLIYKNRDAQAQLGKGARQPDGTLNAYTTGSTSNKPWCCGYKVDNDASESITLLGIEDLYGAYPQRLDGIMLDINNPPHILTTSDNYNNTGAGYDDLGSLGYLTGSGYISAVFGDSDKAFLPKVFLGSSAAYYCDYASISGNLGNGTTCAIIGQPLEASGVTGTSYGMFGLDMSKVCTLSLDCATRLVYKGATT